MLNKTVFLILITLITHFSGIGQPPPPPAPNNFAFTTNDTLGCSPLVVNLVNNTTNASKWSWDFGNGNTSSLKNPTVVYNVPGNYSVSLITTYINGNVDTVVYHELITILEPIIADFEVDETVVCKQNSVVFHNNSIGATNFIWDFGNGITSTESNPSYLFPNEGKYTVKLIAFNENKCSSTKINVNYIDVKQLPVAAINPLGNLCDTSENVGLLPMQIDNNSDYQWIINNDDVLSTAKSFYKFKNYGDNNVQLIVTNSFGCVDSSSKIVTTHQKIIPIIENNDTSICKGQKILFHLTEDYFASLKWNFSRGILNNNKTPNITFSDTGYYSVNVTAVDTNGCSVNATREKIINVFPLPKIEISCSDTIGCAPLMIDFKNVLAMPNQTNAWNFGNGATSADSIANTTYTSEGDYNVKLTVNDSNKCTASKTINNLVHVFDHKSFVEIDDLIGCSPHTFQYIDTTNSSAAWLWNFGNFTSTLRSGSFTIDSVGVYPISLISTSNMGCTDTLYTGLFISVTTPSIPEINSDTIQECNSLTAIFEGEAIGKNTWFWDFGDGSTSEEANPVHTYNEEGIYKVSLQTQDVNGCSFNIDNYNIYKVISNASNFSYNIDCFQKNVTFIDSSNAVQKLWSFGDGHFSTEDAPQNKYTNYGFYIVNLETTDSSGCSSSFAKMINLSSCYSIVNAEFDTINGDADSLLLAYPPGYVPPVVPVDSLFLLNSNINTVYCTPFSIKFENPMDSAINIVWDFGDGTVVNSTGEVAHTYNTGGNFNLNITMETSNNVYHIHKTNFIQLSNITSLFTFQKENLCNGANVMFENGSDTSLNYFWNFGDGVTDTIYSPNHVFAEDRIYISKLVVSDEFSCKSSMLRNVAAGFISPSFDYNSSLCVDDSANFTTNITDYHSYQWNFGDGSSSNNLRAKHAYAAPGIYNVTLETFDTEGCVKTFSLPVSITVHEPNAKFEMEGDSVACSSSSLHFINNSDDAHNWVWNFGDGTQSFEESPTHDFINPGSYDVSLIASIAGCSNTVVKNSAVIIYTPDSAKFDYTITNSCFPVTLDFHDLSNNSVKWTWNFGDDSTSTIQHSSHTFSGTKATQIKLSILDSNNCSSTYSLEGIAPFQADFTIEELSDCVPKDVSFVNNSSNSVQCLWNFGDGTTSTQQNLSHAYQDTGLFVVSLIATSAEGCRDTLFLDNGIKVKKPVVADFWSSTRTADCPPLYSSFVNESINANYMKWDFGDGFTAQNENPSHIYTKSGTYNVSLITSADSICFDTLTRTAYIIVDGPRADYTVSKNVACDSLGVNFINKSTNTFKYNWYFGDGFISDDWNPTHQYANIGTFATTLIVYDSVGCSDNISLDTILIHQSPIANFIMSDSIICTSDQVVFTNNSNYATNYNWNFLGIKQTSEINTKQIFQVENSYKVLLTAGNKYGCFDTISKTIDVFAQPKVDFTTDTMIHCWPSSFYFENISDTFHNVQFNWVFGNGDSSNAVNPNSDYSLMGIYDVTLNAINEYGCSSQIIKENYIQLIDTIAPENTIINYVTVKNENSIEINWKASKAYDFDYYILLIRSGSRKNFVPIDTIYGLNATNYVLNTLNTNAQSYEFLIRTVDKCGNVSLDNELDLRCSILLKTTFEKDRVNVSWNKYENTIISKYNLYKKDENNKFNLIAELNNRETEYVDSSFMCSYTFEYLVEAVIGNPKSSNQPQMKSYFSASNHSKINVINTEMDHQQPKMIRSTVVDNEAIYTEWSNPEYRYDKVISYAVFRSDNSTNAFQLIEIIPAQVNQYLDEKVDVLNQKYFYKIELLNECNIQNKTQDVSSSILLNQEVNDNYIQLYWNKYQNWENGVEKYIIEKRVNEGEWKKIKEVDGNTTNTIDEIMD